MKRSEMVTKISNAIELELIKYLNKDITRKFILKRYSEAALKACETNGMVPPFICTDEICCQHEWEREDTTQ